MSVINIILRFSVSYWWPPRRLDPDGSDAAANDMGVITEGSGQPKAIPPRAVPPESTPATPGPVISTAPLKPDVKPDVAKVIEKRKQEALEHQRILREKGGDHIPSGLASDPKQQTVSTGTQTSEIHPSIVNHTNAHPVNSSMAQQQQQQQHNLKPTNILQKSFVPDVHVPTPPFDSVDDLENDLDHE